MKYTESKKASEIFKKNYVDGLNYLIENRQKKAENIRNMYIKNIFNEQERYRTDLKRMFGWPLVDNEKKNDIKVSSEKLSEENGYCIYRMQFEVIEGLKLTGLFFKLDGNGEKPLVILQHGGLGTPELISGFYGSTSNYNNMLHRVLKQGVHIFAPQLLIWGQDYNVEFDRTSIDARLKRVGSSVTAVEIYEITRILDYFEKQNYVSSFGMVGLSYGGFYTLCTAALDTRIKSAISCSFFSKRDNYPWSDWTWHKSAELFDDAEIAALVYPRKLQIAIGNNDEVFDYIHGLESFENLKRICCNVGTDWVDLIVFGGAHEFLKDDTAIMKLAGDLKSLA